jgi:hypothetical protein
MDLKNQITEFPDKKTKNLWPAIYEEIVSEVKNPTTDIPGIACSFEEKVRTILRKHLDMDLVKNDEKHRKFFKDALKFSINMHTDKMLYKIEVGRSFYKTTGLKRDNRKNKN